MGQAAIARLEHKVILDESVLENLGHVEHIEVVPLRQDQSILDHLLQSVFVVVLYKVVVSIGSEDLVVVWILEH